MGSHQMGFTYRFAPRPVDGDLGDVYRVPEPKPVKVKKAKPAKKEPVPQVEEMPAEVPVRGAPTVDVNKPAGWDDMAEEDQSSNKKVAPVQPKQNLKKQQPAKAQKSVKPAKPAAEKQPAVKARSSAVSPAKTQNQVPAKRARLKRPKKR
jgi:hypothetical protein